MPGQAYATTPTTTSTGKTPREDRGCVVEALFFTRRPEHQQKQVENHMRQMPPHMSGRMLRHDEKLAQALQAREYAAGTSGGGGARDLAREARHKARNEQLEMALEVNPEAFVNTPMLYVACTLNDVPLKAFVDTGAQMTVMTAATAQKCNLLDKVDARFRGVAAGVGAARILGRVHLVTLRFGASTAVDVSITILDQNHGPELLLGLDLLRKYQAVIDLARNAMLIGGKAIPFVEGEKREDKREQQQQQQQQQQRRR